MRDGDQGNFPESRIENSKEYERYKKSHAAFAPGEQLREQYKWDSIGVDLERFRFGRTEQFGRRGGCRAFE